MRNQKFNLYIYTACVGVAIGAFGPWVSIGSSAYTLTDGYGVITLASAGLVGVAVWRWTGRRRRTVMLGAAIVASLGAAVALYDFIDVTFLDDDEGFQAGWGLMVALSSSIVLTALCWVQYRRSRSEHGRRSRTGDVGALAVAIVGAAAFGTVCAVQSADSASTPRWSSGEVKGLIPGNAALKANSGSTNGITWSFWLFGNGGNNCWATKTGERFAYEEVNCGFSVPPKYWQLAAEAPIGGDGEAESLLFFLTRRDVGRLNVLTGRKQAAGGGLTWTSMTMRPVGRRQARHAQLLQNFNYGAMRVPVPACIRKIKVFDWSGRSVRSSAHFPCKIPASTSPLEE